MIYLFTKTKRLIIQRSEISSYSVKDEIQEFFPLKIFSTVPKNVQILLNELFGLYLNNLYLATAIISRKILEVSLSIAFKIKFSSDNKFKKDKDNYFDLKERIDITHNEGLISKATKTKIENIKSTGDYATHSPVITELTKEEVERLIKDLRLFLTEIIERAKGK